MYGDDLDYQPLIDGLTAALIGVILFGAGVLLLVG